LLSSVVLSVAFSAVALGLVPFPAAAATIELVSRVDPAKNAIAATIRVSGRPVQGGDIAFGGGSVWARVSDVLIAQIDPATNEVVARFGESWGSGSVAADDEAVWISAHEVLSVWRLPLP